MQHAEQQSAQKHAPGRVNLAVAVVVNDAAEDQLFDNRRDNGHDQYRKEHGMMLEDRIHRVRDLIFHKEHGDQVDQRNQGNQRDHLQNVERHRAPGNPAKAHGFAEAFRLQAQVNQCRQEQNALVYEQLESHVSHKSADNPNHKAGSDRHQHSPKKQTVYLSDSGFHTTPPAIIQEPQWLQSLKAHLSEVSPLPHKSVPGRILP